jgi:thiol-disulfide isomerase/thioredoxin
LSLRLAGLLLLSVAFALPCRAENVEVGKMADPLFAATLTGLDGKPVRLAQWKGRPAIVNFWARWCGPCRVEIPELVRLNAAQRANGLDIIGIAVEDKVDSVADFAKAYDIDYRVLVAGDHGVPLMQALGNTKTGLPFTIAVDRHGRIVAGKLGAMTPAELKTAAAAALK